MARRYLMDRYDELSGMYAQLPNQGRAADGFHYNPRARRIFLRYNVVEAMLVEVEQLDPDRLPDLHALAHALVRVADIAQSPFTQPPQGKAKEHVIGDERRGFNSAVETWMSVPSLDVEPMGYRRVLMPAEWRRWLEGRWGLDNLSWLRGDRRAWVACSSAS